MIIVQAIRESQAKVEFYWKFLKRFGYECHATWKRDLKMAALIAGLTYLATWFNDPSALSSLKVAITTIVLAWGIVSIGHLFNTPYLLSTEGNAKSAGHWGHGLLGIVMLFVSALLLIGVGWYAKEVFPGRPVIVRVAAPPVPLFTPGEKPIAPRITQAPIWSQSPNAQTGPFGPIFAVELAQEFAKLPKPCRVRVTVAKDKRAFRDTLVWIMTYGADCTSDESSPPTSADEPAPPPGRTEPGMTIHWGKNFEPGARIAHFLDADGFKVQTSNRVPVNSPRELIWIDVGPGNPWK